VKAPRWSDAHGQLVTREAFEARVAQLRAAGAYDPEPGPVRLGNGRLLLSAAHLIPIRLG
jgi:hypothetical protein